MKVLLVLDQFDGANNGNTITARRLYTILKKHGHDVRILASGESRDDKWGLPTVKVPIFNELIKKQGFVFAKPVEKTIEEAVKWADIVHVVMPFMISRKATKLAIKYNKPMTSAFHVQPENIWFSVNLGNVKPLISFTYFFAKQYIFKYHSFIHCPSNMIANQLRKHHYKADIRVISNGIESDFVYNKREKDSCFKGKYLIVMSGRYSHEKRQDLIIEAVKKSKYEKDIQIFLAGQGPVEEEYRRLAKGLTNPIIMQFLTKDKLKDLFSQTDLYIHASDAEIEAMSCMEAFASGLVPVIANSERSATPQFALDERSLFKAGSSDDLVKKIDYWIEHPEEKKEMEYKYAESAKKYALEECVNKMEKMFTDAIETKRKQ